MNFEELFDHSAPSTGPPRSGSAAREARAFRISTTRPRRETTVITVVGPLDLLSTPRFAEFLRARLHDTASELVLDLSRVSFLGVAAIEVLLNTESHARSTGLHLILATDTHVVDRALQALDLTSRFSYCDRPELASSQAHSVPQRRAPQEAPAQGTTPSAPAG